MQKFQTGVSILTKLKISKNEVISYLESLNVTNDQIMEVLQKKPTLPGYEKLPWVIESKMDKDITTKLKSNKDLNLAESLRLKETLESAMGILRKGHAMGSEARKLPGLQKFIKKLG